jgi:PD-(D/E)XK nuclease superfamily
MPANALQLALFEDLTPRASPREILGQMTWSYSKRSTLEQCVRKYYYEYYGSNKKVASAEPAKDILHELKGVQNRHQRAGDILHRVIGTYLRQAQGGTLWDINRAEGWARHILALDQEYSRDNPDGGNRPDVAFPPVLLSEYLLRIPDADALCAEATERLVTAVRSFLIDERYRPFRVAGSTSGALIEEHISLRDFPCRIDGRVDLAYQYGECITVVDWKLGVDDGTGDDSLQLSVYALWAIDRFDCSPEYLRICKVHLGSGDIVDFRVDGQVLAARARIIQDAERMAVLHDYGQSATSDAFTPCMQRAVCALCPFATVCPTGRGVISA